MGNESASESSNYATRVHPQSSQPQPKDFPPEEVKEREVFEEDEEEEDDSGYHDSREYKSSIMHSVHQRFWGAQHAHGVTSEEEQAYAKYDKSASGEKMPRNTLEAHPLKADVPNSKV